jgi:hypothetical protein
MRLRTRLAGAALAAVSVVALAGSAAAGTATEPEPQSLVEDFVHPGAEQILAEHGLIVRRGDGHIVFVTSYPVDSGVQCQPGQIQVERVLDAPPYGILYCFRTIGSEGYLAMEVRGTFVVRGGDLPVQAMALLASGDHHYYQIPPQTYVPIDPGDGSELPDATLLQLNL